MSLLSPLLRDALIEGVMLARAKRKSDDLKAGIGLYLLAFILSIAGIYFLIYSCDLAFQSTFTPLQSALLSAASMFVLCIVAVGIAKFLIKKRAKAKEGNELQVMTMIQSAIDLLEHEVGAPIRDNPKVALMMAGVAGLFAGKHVR